MNQLNYGNTHKSARPAPQRSGRPLALPQHLSLDLHAADSAGRQALEACIARKFQQQFGARIQHFLPQLLSLSESGQLDAVVGIRLAAESELFLERYLDIPVERTISQVVRRPIDRDQVVEIGNLAAAVPGTAALLFALLATILDGAGIRWVACTATPQVRSMLEDMQFPAHTICEADAAALGPHAQQWGDYYASRPEVVVGSTRLAATAAVRDPGMALLIQRLAGPVSRIAGALKTARQS